MNRCAFSSVVVAVLCATFSVTVAQNSACTTAVAPVQSACGAYQSAVQGQASLAGADDATLTAAVNASPTKPSPECCNAVAAFNGPSPPCACDSNVIPLAQSQGFSSAQLLTLQRASSIACASLSPPISFGRPAQTAC